MLRKAISAAINQRKITFVIAIAIVLFGLYSYYIIPKQEDPDINPPFAMIKAVYPGASPQTVEKLVTKKIEDKLIEIEGYESSHSYSRNSVSIVILRLRNGTDTEKAWRTLRQKMDDLRGELPEETGTIDMNTELSNTAGMIISLSGKDYSYEELEFFAEELKKDLMQIDGISKFDVDGVQKKEIKVLVDPAKLNQYKLSLQDIVNMIKASNVEIPAGVIEGNSSINVSVSGTYESIEDIRNTIVYVSSTTGLSVRLQDIAQVDVGLEESNYKIKHNGENSVLLTGYFLKDKNIVLIGKEVDAALTRSKANLPSDVTMDKILYQPTDVAKSTNNFILNLIEGMLFVIIVVLIGMGFKNSLVVSMAIPLSIFTTFVFMNLLDIKIHQISITALIIALGMLVDNAIVISDAIQVRIDRGDDKLDACVSGVLEVALPVFTSTLTTVAAFIPLLMLNSVAGEYVSSLPLIVIISLSASYIIALFVTPTLAYIFFKPGKGIVKKSRTRNFFMDLLGRSMRNKRITIALAVTLFGLSIFTALQLGLQFFPYADKDMMYISITSEKDNDLAKTENITQRVFNILKEQKEIKSYTAAIGDGLPKFYNAIPISTPSKDSAQILIRVDLKSGNRFKSNSQFADYLQGSLDTQITGGSATVNLLEIAEPTGAPIVLRVSGEDLESLVDASSAIKTLLKEIPGTMNIEDDHTDRTYQYDVKFDSNLGAFYGLTSYDIQNEINIALMGRVPSKLRQDGKEYDIRVKSVIDSKDDLENMMIKSQITGNKTLLKSIAPINLDYQYPIIKKYDRNMTVTVYSDVKTGYNPVDIEKSLEKKLEKANFGAVSVVFDGEREKIMQYFGDLGAAAVFAILLVYLILLFQFGSFLQPLIILITIPLSIIGSIFGLLLFRQPLSFTALLGIVSLAGVVVNNAIILLDFINAERKEGKNVAVSCIDAVSKRFRPIMLTTVTTVIGLIPLAFGGSSLMVPMAVALMSGLMISTLLTLVVIPVVYIIFEDKAVQS